MGARADGRPTRRGSAAGTGRRRLRAAVVLATTVSFGLWLVAGAAPASAGTGTTGATGATGTTGSGTASAPATAGASGTPGTVGSAPGGTSTGGVEHASALASRADPTSGSLSLIASQSIHGGYVSAGVGLRNLGFGSITVGGIPVGSSVVAAYLVWDILDNSDESSLAEGQLDGTPIVGSPMGSGASPCWPTNANYSFYADVTSLVGGNGSYTLSGFASGGTDGSDPWSFGSPAPEAEGASLVVFYENPSSPETVLQLYGGADETQSGNLLTADLSGFTVSGTPAASTTYIVADGQGAGSEALFDESPLAGSEFLGAAPQAAPTYTFGNLWDDSTFDVSSSLTPGDTSETAGVEGFDDCLVWVGQVLSVGGSAAPARTVVYVHGINGNYTQYQCGNLVSGFSAILSQLCADPGQYRLDGFAYYQDQGYSSGGGCPGMPEPNTNVGLLYADPNSVDPTICDSKGALAYSSVALDALIGAETGPVTVMANSMGAAITRGWLTYAYTTGADPSLQTADSVIFLQGAQAGSWAAAVGEALNGASSVVAPLLHYVLGKVSQLAGLDLNRPGVMDVTPLSLWYDYVNPVIPSPGVPPQLAYYNFYSNININLQQQLLWWTIGIGSLDAGDLVMLPGSNNPNDEPLLGGAKFLPGNVQTSNRWQFSLSDQVNINVSDFLWPPALVGDVNAIVGNPINHFHFGSNVASVTVTGCQQGSPTVTVSQEVMDILQNPTDACS